MRAFFILTLFLFCALLLNSQEILTGLQFNEVLRHKATELEATTTHSKKAAILAEPLQLPFFDDFAASNIYPDTKLWMDKEVFINKDFPLYPTNTGAATFDALDEKGVIHENATWIPFPADELTSKPIRLDSIFTPVTRELTPADSIYLSFYYQPQGTADEPEATDSLLLEFARRGDTVFSHIDSVRFSAQIWLEDANDTIKPLDTLWSPPGSGCNPDIYIISFDFYTFGDSITFPCDSVFAPDTIWITKWFAEGSKLSDFKSQYGRDFVQVMVPIYQEPGDTVYFYDAFQFRFRNYASIANNIIPSWKSNCDQWNIDYVYLNYNRNAGDTTYRRITFSQRAPSFLNKYQAMPYSQYRGGSTVSLLKTRFEMFIANLDDQERNTSYEYHVQQVNGDFSYGYYGGVCNLPPFDLFGFQNCNSGCGIAHACPPVNSAFNFDYSRDTTSYIIRHYVSDSSEAEILIDSLVYTQGFYNYFAYDDGTPELGYGIEPAGAQLAYRFDLVTPDTLQGIQMYFNRTQNNENDIFFNLKVWRDNNGVPGEELYTSPSIKPEWEDGLYEFTSYMFEEPLVLTGTFYVGWQQQASGSLNVGFDRNNDNKEQIFYFSQDSWLNSIFPGSLLIRPIIGSDMILKVDGQPSDENPEKLLVFPNPASTHFKVRLASLSSSATLGIYNIYGELVHQQTGVTGEIPIAQLAQGLYIVRIRNEESLYSAKLLINR